MLVHRRHRSSAPRPERRRRPRRSGRSRRRRSPRRLRRDERMLLDDPLHLERVDVVAATDVHLGGTSAQNQVSVADSNRPRSPSSIHSSPLVGGRRPVPVPVSAHRTGGTDTDHVRPIRRRPARPSSLTSSISTPSAGRPTVWSSTAGASPGRVPVRIGASVHAYRTTTGQPSRFGHRSHEVGRHRRRTGSADPEGRQVGLLERRQFHQFRPLGRHPLADRDPFGHHGLQHLRRRPGSDRDDRGDHVLDLVPHPRHVPGVGERERHEAPVHRHRQDAAHRPPVAGSPDDRTRRPSDRRSNRLSRRCRADQSVRPMRARRA